MARRLRAKTQTGFTLYANIINSSSLRWNGTQFEVFSDADYADYVITMTEQGSSGIYLASWPAIVTPGNYDVIFYVQDGGSPADGDHIAGSQTYTVGN